LTTRSLGAVVSSRLRAEPAAWLFSLSCLLGYLAAMGVDEQSPGYPLAVAIRGHGAIIVLAPIGAGCAAWKAGRYRRAGWPKRTWRRSPARLALAEIAATTAVQLAAYATVVVAVAAASAESGLPWEPQLYLVAATALVGWTSLGFVLGWWMRAELAMPLVVVGSYLAIVFPDAIEPLWVRHLTGTYLGCCFQDAVLDAGAVRGPILLTLGVTVASLLLVAAGHRPLLACVAVVVVTGAIGGAVTQVDHLGADPIVPRTGSVQCTGAAPVVCTWPEQAQDRPKIAEVSKQVLARWKTAGLQVPERISTQPIVDDEVPTIVVQTAEHPTTTEIIAALALGAVPQPDCPGGAPTDLYVASQVAWADVAVEGGMTADDITNAVGPDIADQLATVRAASPEARVAWLHEVNRAVASCSRSTPSLPR
jgi:hypothetical protein